MPDRRGGVLQSAVIVLGGIAFADMLCEGAAADWAAVYLRNSLHAVPVVAGMGYAAYALAMVIVRLCGNWLFTRFAAHRLLSFLAAFASLGFAAGLVLARPVTVLVGFAFLGAGLGSVVPIILREGGGRGGRLWVGRLRRGTCRDRRNRLCGDTAHRSIFDPISRRYRRGGHWDGEGAEVRNCAVPRVSGRSHPEWAHRTMMAGRHRCLRHRTSDA
jgi:hypothetical protein